MFYILDIFTFIFNDDPPRYFYGRNFAHGGLRKQRTWLLTDLFPRVKKKHTIYENPYTIVSALISLSLSLSLSLVPSFSFSNS